MIQFLAFNCIVYLLIQAKSIMCDKFIFEFVKPMVNT